MARAEFNQKAIQRQIEKQKKRLIAAGFQIEREAKQLCPVDQGRLRASISTNWTDSGLAEAKTGEKAESWDGVLSSDVIEDGNFKVVVGTNVFYACVKPSTKVLTDKGWVRISYIKKGDVVLTQTGEYHKVIDTIKVKNIDHPSMVTIEVEWRKDRIRKITMTEEHKILVYRDGRNKWIMAKDLLSSDNLFCLPKIAINKGISKFDEFQDIYCLNCGEKINKKNNFNIKRKYCSQKCRNEYWKKNGNPNIGSKRDEACCKKLSISRNKMLLEYPENHINRILARKGFKTSTEKKVEEWLKERKLQRRVYQQYLIGKHFVDFYIPSLNLIYEADGAYWHKDQNKDINRDKDILNIMPNAKIHHLHFYDKFHTPKDMDINPLPNVYYSVCNPDTNSYVDSSVFKMFKIKSITPWIYKSEPKGKQKGIRTAYLYDLSVDKVHSYYTNAGIVSNSFIEYGTYKIPAIPYMRAAFGKYANRIGALMAEASQTGMVDGEEF